MTRSLKNLQLLAAVLGFASLAHASLPTYALSKARLGVICWDTKNTDDALACWLQENPNVANAMLYRDSTSLGSWSTWPSVLQTELYQDFTIMVAWYDLGMPALNTPPFFPIEIPPSGPPDPTLGFWLPETLGRQVYLGQTAASLAAELTAQFSWSIATYPPSDLLLLLNQGDTMNYVSNAAEPGYYLQFDGDGPLQSDPTYIATFFKSNNLIGTSAADTIARLYNWEKQLKHFFINSGTNETTASVYPYFWGPNAPPIPDAAVIMGTNYTGPVFFPFSHFTAGCSGTMEFMKSVLRTMNIPVINQWVSCGHATPLFPTAGLAMTHGDDPYTWLAWVTSYPGFPAPDLSQYLIPISQWNQLFPAGQSGDACVANVGIQPVNIAIQYGSDALMNSYCQDLASGADEASGQVYASLSPYYPLQTLQNMGLWTTLSNKQAALNYCSTP